MSASTGNLGALAGRTVYLDPGHAGTAPPAKLTADDGRGGTKPCNAPGTASADGWPEHTFTWEISQQLRTILEDAGATVLLSRADDVHRADCIDARTYKENASAADVVVSLHADVSGPGNTGFHISAVTDPLPHNLADQSSLLASTVRDAMVSAGLPVSNYLGTDGLNPRADLSGLNLSTKPKILIEFGNMRDADDLAALRSQEGRRQRARAVAEGLASYLS
ncbi:N-acetylmuramoyl-L-alanine amidase [Corynebacterium variabile]|uniref:N-acetylmuramoyl-L-alanine amidase n=1 Tax=Corynebacterium variabile TaxID=1727 RepID=UPI003A950FF0